MKKTIQHIAIYLLTATVLFASTGVSVHQFYCHCLGKMTASVFKPADPCDTESMSACCKVKLADQPGEKGCADCTSKYVHLDVEYLLFGVGFELHAPQFLPAAKYFAAQKSVPQKSAPTWENDLPPPPYGKALLPHIQSYRC